MRAGTRRKTASSGPRRLKAWSPPTSRPTAPAARAGILPGDLLVAIDANPIEEPSDVLDVLHTSTRGRQLTYTVLRGAQQGIRQLTLQGVPEGHRALYYVQAAVAMFTLIVGCVVRLRRTGDQASLHFFWLSVAFFGVLGFSFSGRFDRLDWFFYWADVVSLLLLPPLFFHFALVFPERPHAWVRTPMGRGALPLMYLPALLLGGVRAAALARPSLDSIGFGRFLETLDRLELTYLAFGIIGGLTVMIRALGSVRSMTARRQLRWIVGGTTIGGLPFIVGYALPWVAGFDPGPQLGLLTVPLAFVPLAFASAVVRYRLMDVEVIIKRTVVYAAAVSAIAAIYAVLLKLASELFLGGTEQHNSIIAVLATLVVVLLAPMVKNTIQMVLDRAYYRDRYDYRRALVGFARDLNSDLDLQRLSERLVGRVTETLLLDRMALLIAPLGSADAATTQYVQTQAVGFERGLAPLCSESGIGHRLQQGETVSLDDPFTIRRFSADEVAHWRDFGRALLRAVRVEGRHDRGDGARRQGKRRAAQQRGHGPDRGGRGSGGDGARKRTALLSAAPQGGRARSRARLQRQHHRVAARRPAGHRPGRSRGALESGARRVVWRVAGGGRRGVSCTSCSTRRSCRSCRRRARTTRTSRCIACR